MADVKAALTNIFIRTIDEIITCKAKRFARTDQPTENYLQLCSDLLLWLESFCFFQLIVLLLCMIQSHYSHQHHFKIF